LTELRKFWKQVLLMQSSNNTNAQLSANTSDIKPNNQAKEQRTSTIIIQQKNNHHFVEFKSLAQALVAQEAERLNLKDSI